MTRVGRTVRRAVDDSCSASLGIIFDNFLNVSLVLPGSPAHLSGQVALYDKLLSVDGTPLQSSSTQQEVQELLRRDAGQRVKLLFARARFRKDQTPREEEVELVAAPLLTMHLAQLHNRPPVEPATLQRPPPPALTGPPPLSELRPPILPTPDPHSTAHTANITPARMP